MTDALEGLYVSTLECFSNDEHTTSNYCEPEIKHQTAVVGKKLLSKCANCTIKKLKETFPKLMTPSHRNYAIGEIGPTIISSSPQHHVCGT